MAVIIILHITACIMIKLSMKINPLQKYGIKKFYITKVQSDKELLLQA